jgi:hypothetical protein
LSTNPALSSSAVLAGVTASQRRIVLRLRERAVAYLNGTLVEGSGVANGCGVVWCGSFGAWLAYR